MQHIESSFVTGFVTWLRGAVRTKMVLAESGMLLERGTVYVPPGDHHIGATADGRVLLSTAPQIAGFRPSGSHLLFSLARTYGKRALGIVLTGMGTHAFIAYSLKARAKAFAHSHSSDLGAGLDC